jgi:xylan 1,4-beta-xylosidase
MRPLVELSFMPELLASGNQTWSHYKAHVTPPKDYSQWADLIASLVRHLIQRYGLQEVLQWNFEVGGSTPLAALKGPLLVHRTI